MNDLGPGYEIEEVLGEVFGLTVRSRNVGSQIGASLKSLAGGELKGMTKLLIEGREHATERLVERSKRKAATRSSPSVTTPPSSGPPGPRSAPTAPPSAPASFNFQADFLRLLQSGDARTRRRADLHALPARHGAARGR